MDLGTFFIDSIIVHDVPRRAADGSGDALTLSEVPSSLDQSLRNFFKERITRSLGKQAFEVEHDPASSSPVPQHVVEIIGDASKLVNSSQEIAKHLHASQTGLPPQRLWRDPELLRQLRDRPAARPEQPDRLTTELL